jgi:hypothetical protein
MVIGPSFFEAVRKLFDGLPLLGSPDEKTGCCGTDATHDQQKTFHALYRPPAGAVCADEDFDAARGADVYGPGALLRICRSRYT